MSFICRRIEVSVGSAGRVCKRNRHKVAKKTVKSTRGRETNGRAAGSKLEMFSEDMK